MKKSDIIEQTKTNAIILENTLKNIVQPGHKLRMSASSWRGLTDAQREGLANRRCDDDWAKAKVAFLDHQKDLGFTWVITQGHGGPAVLENISPPPDFGIALAAVV